MKKNQILLSLISIIDLGMNSAWGQSSSAGNSNIPISTAPLDYLGWTFGVNQPLNIVNEDGSWIGFYTNAGSGSLNNMRMWIYDGNGQANDGFVGIGDFATAGATPQQLLHILDNSVSGRAYAQWTNSALSGHTALNGFLVGNNGVNAELIQQEDAPIFFYTNDASNNIKERMRIHYGNGYEDGITPNSFTTKVSISYADPTATFPLIINPVSMLNLGEDPTAGGVGAVGQRPWMDVGVFGARSTDDFYVGLKREGIDRDDAVLVWGDNYSNPSWRDYLRFIFATSPSKSSGEPSNPDGLEVGRFTPDGHFGIGNFTPIGNGGGSGEEPARMLEVYDPTLVNSQSANPQLRLTYDPSTSPNILTTGAWADFQEMSTGDLYIHPCSTGVNRFVGINVAAPSNTLEITSTNSVSPEPAGLRFTNLTNAISTPVTNPDIQNGVLSVDNDGDVIFVIDQNTGGGVGLCGGATTNFVTYNNAANSICTTGSLYYNPSNARLGINNTSPSRQLDIQGGAVSISDVALGTVANTTPLVVKTLTGDSVAAGLAILDNTAMPSSTALDLYATSTIGTIAVRQRSLTFKESAFNKHFITYAHNSGAAAYCYEMLVPANVANYPNSKHSIEITDNDFASSSGFTGLWVGNLETDANSLWSLSSYGIRGSCVGDKLTAATAGLNFAGRFDADNGDYTYAVYADAPNSLQNGITENYGVYAQALDYTNVGTLNVAVYGEAPSNAVSSTVIGTSVAGYFNGDVYTSSAQYYTSDASLKENVNLLPDGSGTTIINLLTPSTYSFDQVGHPNLQLPSGIHCGLIAEEVEQVLPELVKSMHAPAKLDSTGNIIDSSFEFKALNYTGLIPYLIQNAKEQNQRLEVLTDQIEALQEQLNNCCNAGERQINPNGNDKDQSSIDVKLTNVQAIILDQNVPNPFAEQTKITYFIPDNVKQAQIFFYDNKGVVLKTVDIVERGAGQINVYAADLSSGSYTYSLIADGKLIETKKMVKTN